jgi:hypothetical protein
MIIKGFFPEITGALLRDEPNRDERPRTAVRHGAKVTKRPRKATTRRSVRHSGRGDGRR